MAAARCVYGDPSSSGDWRCTLRHCTPTWQGCPVNASVEVQTDGTPGCGLDFSNLVCTHVHSTFLCRDTGYVCPVKGNIELQLNGKCQCGIDLTFPDCAYTFEPYRGDPWHCLITKGNCPVNGRARAQLPGKCQCGVEYPVVVEVAMRLHGGEENFWDRHDVCLNFYWDDIDEWQQERRSVKIKTGMRRARSRLIK